MKSFTPSIFVDSLKRLYKEQKISLKEIETLLKNEKITIKEFDYILET